MTIHQLFVSKYRAGCSEICLVVCRLDVDAMKRGAEVFVGLHDFTTFSRESAKTNMWKTMERAEVRDGRGYAIPSCDE